MQHTADFSPDEAMREEALLAVELAQPPVVISRLLAHHSHVLGGVHSGNTGGQDLGCHNGFKEI